MPLYARLRMDESSGTNAPDDSGNGRDGTLVNMEDADWTTGKYNNGLYINEGDTSNEYVDWGNIADFERTDPFSVCCWFKTTKTSWQTLMARRDGDGGDNYRGWAFMLDTNGYLYFYLISTWPSNVILVSVPTGYKDGVWHHAAATYDGSSSASGVHIYVDNVDKALTTTYDTLSATISVAVNTQIGCQDGTQWRAVSYFDEACILDHAASAADVDQIYNNTYGMAVGGFPVCCDSAIVGRCSRIVGRKCCVVKGAA